MKNFRRSETTSFPIPKVKIIMEKVTLNSNDVIYHTIFLKILQ